MTLADAKLIADIRRWADGMAARYEAREQAANLRALVDFAVEADAGRDAATARAEAAEAKAIRDGDYAQRSTDDICHYRNLAIVLGAKPDEMRNDHDRKLCREGLGADLTREEIVWLQRGCWEETDADLTVVRAACDKAEADIAAAREALAAAQAHESRAQEHTVRSRGARDRADRAAAAAQAREQRLRGLLHRAAEIVDDYQRMRGVVIGDLILDRITAALAEPADTSAMRQHTANAIRQAADAVAVPSLARSTLAAVASYLRLIANGVEEGADIQAYAEQLRKATGAEKP